MYQYKYPHPAVSVDCAIFGWDGRKLNLLLIERGGQPFRGKWAFPGGFVEIDEDLEPAARRELQEETSVKLPALHQFGAFGDPKRDPRERIITIGYFTLVNLQQCRILAASDARKVQWWPVTRPPALAFDHVKILESALAALEAHARLHPIGREALPREFTGAELAALYSAVLRKRVQAKKLLAKLSALGLVKKAGKRGGSKGERYVFVAGKYRKLERKGLGDKGFASIS
jgi:8-oxo-dGTP diphosphatase